MKRGYTDMKMEIIGELAHIYSMLEDQESREVFCARMNWLMTGNYRYIADITERYRPELVGYPYISVDKALHVIKDSPVIFYGAGGDAYFYRDYWKSFDSKQVIGFCDADREKQKNGFCGEKVLSPEEAVNHKEAYFLIMSSGHGYFMKHFLLKQGIQAGHIIDHIFPQLKVSRDMYYEPGIIHFEKEEVFVDGGSYDLGKAIDLKMLTGVKKVYAFEADPKNYEYCQSIKQKEAFEEAQIYPYGLWSGRETMRFHATGDSGALFSDNGSIEVETCALDDIVDSSDKITFIKMDIEGAELEALKGCSKTIKRDKPKLAVCIYHKPEDMYELPMFIKSLVPDYRLYMRAYSNREIEMVLYAV